MKTKNALPFILALGMTAGSTAVYAQTAATDLNADVTATTDVTTPAADAATSTDATTEACAAGEACADTSADASTTMAPAADVEADADASATADAGADPMTSADTDTSAAADAGAAAPLTPMGSTDATTDLAADADADADIRANLTDIASVADTSELVGARAYDANDEWIGEISAVIPAEGDITEEQFVIDVGGFLGIGEKPVALTASSVQVQLDADGGVEHVVVDHTMSDLEQMPEVEM